MWGIGVIYIMEKGRLSGSLKAPQRKLRGSKEHLLRVGEGVIYIMEKEQVLYKLQYIISTVVHPLKIPKYIAEFSKLNPDKSVIL